MLREDLVDWYFSQYGNHEFLKSTTSIRRRIEELEAARDGIRKQTEAEILLAALRMQFRSQANMHWSMTFETFYQRQADSGVQNKSLDGQRQERSRLHLA